MEDSRDMSGATIELRQHALRTHGHPRRRRAAGRCALHLAGLATMREAVEALRPAAAAHQGEGEAAVPDALHRARSVPTAER